MKVNEIYNGDCLNILEKIEDKSIDFIFTDLPYGITNNEWDKKIPLEDYVILNGKTVTKTDFLLNSYKNGLDYKSALNQFKENKRTGLFTHFNRIIKDNGCIALWAQNTYANDLINSNPKFYRYEWIIEKTNSTGFLNARKMPMKCHEKVLIFYKNLPVYNPQKTTGHPPIHSFTKHTQNGSNYGESIIGITGGGSTERYPRDIIKFKWDTQKSSIHPTQKPIDACKYFIKTYTNEGDLVLDVTCGSGSIPLAAKELNRNFIGIEKDKNIFHQCINRLYKGE